MKMFSKGKPRILVTPQAIVVEHFLHTETRPRPQVLVEWQGALREEATWEDWETQTSACSTADLEGKVVFVQGGNVTTQREIRTTLTSQGSTLETSGLRVLVGVVIDVRE